MTYILPDSNVCTPDSLLPRLMHLSGLQVLPLQEQKYPKTQISTSSKGYSNYSFWALKRKGFQVLASHVKSRAAGSETVQLLIGLKVSVPRNVTRVQTAPEMPLP